MENSWINKQTNKQNTGGGLRPLHSILVEGVHLCFNVSPGKSSNSNSGKVWHSCAFRGIPSLPGKAQRFQTAPVPGNNNILNPSQSVGWVDHIWHRSPLVIYALFVVGSLYVPIIVIILVRWHAFSNTQLAWNVAIDKNRKQVKGSCRQEIVKAAPFHFCHSLHSLEINEYARDFQC